MEIPAFLRSYPPFDGLSEDQLAEVVRHTHIEYFPSGAVVLQQGGQPSHSLYVIRTGAMELIDDGQVLDLLLEGETFGHPSMLSGLGPTFTVRAHEDAICYAIDREAAEDVLATQSGLVFLSSNLRRRITRALEGLEPETKDAWTTPVGSLVRRPPVTCEPTITVREAAEVMTAERVSSLLMQTPGGWAIVTDRDFRTKLIAAGATADVPVGEVATAPLVTVEGTTLAAEVIALMLHEGIHHMPIEDGAGHIIGMVTDTDLMGLHRKTPFALKADIERATTLEGVVGVGRTLPEAVGTLVDAHQDAVEVGHVIGVTVDSLTRKLLDLGIAELGDPPCSWAWLAFGSEARLEQALVTDQDNAMVIDPGVRGLDDVDPYFERLARFVNDAIEEAGIPKCHAGVIASNRLCRDTPVGWAERFARGIGEGDWSGGVLGAIGFDVRQIAGPLEARPIFDEAIRKASGNERFIRRLASTTVKDRPPTGFTRAAVIHLPGRTVESLDVKRGGITLITSIARVYAVMAGIPEVRTLRRLEMAAERELIQEASRLALEESFRLLWQTRLEHQVRRRRAGEDPDDAVDPRSLGPLARQGLKHAFRAIDQEQGALAGLLGIRR